MNKETTKRVVPESALADALDLIERLRGGDERLTSEEYYARRDHIRAALDQPQGEERVERRKLILVCGSRDWGFHDARQEDELYRRLSQQDVLGAIVLHGGARGADRLAEEICRENNVHTAEMNARWDAFGKRAGYLRNCAMLDLQPDLVIAFTTGSRGTQHTIDAARKRGIPVEVHGTERQDIDQQEGEGA